MGHILTDADMYWQVKHTLGDEYGDFDIPGIVDDIKAKLGGIRDVGLLSDREYWRIVFTHDSTQKH